MLESCTTVDLECVLSCKSETVRSCGANTRAAPHKIKQSVGIVSACRLYLNDMLLCNNHLQRDFQPTKNHFEKLWCIITLIKKVIA